MPVPGGVRARRQSILDSDVAPSELLNAPEPSIQTRARARTNSSAGVPETNGAPEVESQNARAVEVLQLLFADIFHVVTYINTDFQALCHCNIT